MVWRLLLGFDGRISRPLFWTVQIPLFVLLWLYLMHVDPLLARWFPYSVFEGLTVALALGAPLIWVQCAIAVKRCHDRGKSGFWALLLFIPGVNLLWLLVDCGLLPPARETDQPALQTAP